jgi:hypothetical protein
MQVLLRLTRSQCNGGSADVAEQVNLNDPARGWLFDRRGVLVRAPWRGDETARPIEVGEPMQLALDNAIAAAGINSRQTLLKEHAFCAERHGDRHADGAGDERTASCGRSTARTRTRLYVMTPSSRRSTATRRRCFGSVPTTSRRRARRVLLWAGGRHVAVHAGSVGVPQGNKKERSVD